MDKHSKCVIYWVDIAAPEHYWAIEDDASLAKVVSSGYLIKESPTEVVIAQTISQEAADSDKYGGLLTIPRGAVTKIEVE